MMRIKCNGCGVMLPFQPSDGGRAAICQSCGHHFLLPVIEVPPAPEPEPTAHSRGLPWWAAAVGMVIIAGIAALLTVLLMPKPQEDAAKLREQMPRIVALKAEAERLAVAGQLEQAHERYRELEAIAGGRAIKDSALWDLTERAKQDQDRVYDLLLTRQANDQLERRKALLEVLNANTGPTPVNPNLPQTPYPPGMDLVRPTTAPATAPSTLPVTIPAATRPVEAPPSTAPATRPVVQQARPTTRPMAAVEQPAGDERIIASMQRGVDFLLAQFEGDQVRFAARPKDLYLEGANALAVYALLEAGRVLPDPRLQVTHPQMKNLIERMKEHLMMTEPTNPAGPATYARSFRVMALSVHARSEDRTALAADVEWLLRANTDGAYTYSDRVSRLDQNIDGGNPRFYIEPGQERVVFHNGEGRVPVRPKPISNVARHYRPTSSPGGGNYSSPYSGFRSDINWSEPVGLPWDNSNTQIAHFAVWSAAQTGILIPYEYWVAGENHWLACQLPSGMWDYDANARAGNYAMTVGGIASLLAFHDYLDAFVLGGAVGKDAYYAPLHAALNWLERRDTCLDVALPPVQYVGYNLFALSRVGLHGGFKHLGGHDWYRELAPRILSSQHPNGAWGREAQGPNAVIDTAFILLFLARGQQPVMINKLRYEGYWNNRSRDAANLSRFTAQAMERPLRWQIVSSNQKWTDWLDTPLLYIAGHQPPKLEDEDVARLRAFVDAGGMIFIHADGSAGAFNSFASTLGRRLFPGRPLVAVPRGHALWSLQYKVDPAGLDLRSLSNGARIVMVQSAKDMATAWQMRDPDQFRLFQLGANLFAYAAGKPDARAPVALSIPPEPADKPTHEVAIARVRHGGDWDIEPFAWMRFSRQFTLETSWKLKVLLMPMEDLAVHRPALAHITGTKALEATDEQLAALRRYVESGGTVLIDACGGSEEFARSVPAVLERAFPGARLSAIPDEHPMKRNLPKMMLRPCAEAKLGGAAPPIQWLQAGQGQVIFSPLDLTEGLLAAPTWDIIGYTPAAAQRMVRNVILGGI